MQNAGWMTHKLESREWEIYQQSQICRWHYSIGRKPRGIKELLDDGEKGEWKTWLKTQHSKRCSLPGRKAMTTLVFIKKQRHCFANKGLCSKSYHFSSSRVWMWELDHGEGWVPKNYLSNCGAGKTLESPLDSKIKPVNPKGNQPWIFTRRTDAEAPRLWPHDVKSWHTGKYPDGGKDEGRRRRGPQRINGWMASPTQWMWVWGN